MYVCGEGRLETHIFRGGSLVPIARDEGVGLCKLGLLLDIIRAGLSSQLIQSREDEWSHLREVALLIGVTVRGSELGWHTCYTTGWIASRCDSRCEIDLFNLHS